MNCGFYEREITPPIGTELPGQYDQRVSTGVKDRLYAKAAVFGDGSTLAALLVLDAVDVPEEFCEPVFARVEALTGLTKEDLVICATHTHQGIPVGEAIGCRPDPDYLRELGRIAADCVLLAVRRMQPCSLHFAVGQVEGISFVRDYLCEDGTVRTNPSRSLKLIRSYSEPDTDLPALYVQAEDGSLLGVLYGFACHQDCVGKTEFTGDYSSEVSRQIKAHYGQDAVSVYLTAPCGDINNIDFLHDWYRPNYLEMGRRIAAELIRTQAEAEPVREQGIRLCREQVACRYRRASAELIAQAEESIRTGQKIPHAMLAGTRYAELVLQYERQREEEGKPERELPVQVFRLGDLIVYALPGEFYHALGARLKAAAGGKCLIATLTAGDCGYLATPEMYETYVYPAQLCDGSMFMPETGDLLADRAAAMARSLLETE